MASRSKTRAAFAESVVGVECCDLHGRSIPVVMNLAHDLALGCLGAYLEIVAHFYCIKP